MIAASTILLTVKQPRPEKVWKNWLAGESACPTEAQALARQRGTDAFVCQPGDCFVREWLLWLVGQAVSPALLELRQAGRPVLL